MFCESCGTKNAENAIFCENCGHALTSEKKVKEPFTNKLKKISKKTKIIIASVFVAIIALIVTYNIIGSSLKPNKVAEKFFLAVMNQNVDELYKYYDMGDSAFVTKEMYSKLKKDEIEEAKKIKITNYTLQEVNSNDLTKTIKIVFVIEGKTDPEEVEITLAKDKKKKYIFFENWKVATNGVELREDLEISVLKGSKLTVEGIEVDKKYISSEKSTDIYDVYAMPNMFLEKYNISVELPFGFTVNDTFKVNSYSDYTNKLSLATTPEDFQTKLIDAIKNVLPVIYDAAKDKKSFDEIKSKFVSEGQSDLKEAYDELVDDIGSKDFTSITFNEFKVNTVGLSSNRINITTKITFDYTYDKVLEDEQTESVKKTYSDEMTFKFIYKDGKLELVDASSLYYFFTR